MSKRNNAETNSHRYCLAGFVQICWIMFVSWMEGYRRCSPPNAATRSCGHLNAGGAVRVADLAAELDVSEMTVRRDLDALDAQNLLRKVHGGAVTRHNRGEEPGSSVKAAQQRAEKAAIATVAAATVEDGMTIAISAGTTTTELARRLRHRPSITVVTNSVSVFQVLTDPAADAADAPQVYLSGGVRTPSDALVGPIADAAIASFRVDATYLGVHGLDPDAGLTTPNIAEAQTNRTLIGIGARLVVLADHTKFGEVGTNVFARLPQVHTLIVDDGLAVEDRAVLAAQVGTPADRHGGGRERRRDGADPLAAGRRPRPVVLLAARPHPGARADRRPLPSDGDQQSQLRFDRQTGQWVIIAALRQDRTYKPPPDQCPLCPGPSGLTSEIPAPDYDVVGVREPLPEPVRRGQRTVRLADRSTVTSSSRRPGTDVARSSASPATTPARSPNSNSRTRASSSRHGATAPRI